MSDTGRGDGGKPGRSPEFILPGDDPELDALVEKLQPKGAAGYAPKGEARNAEPQAAAAKPAAAPARAETARRRTRALFVAFGVLTVTAPLVVILSGRVTKPDVKAEASAAAVRIVSATPAPSAAVPAGAAVVPPVTPSATTSASAAASADAVPSAATAPRPARPPKKPHAADAGAAESFPPDMFQ